VTCFPEAFFVDGDDITGSGHPSKRKSSLPVGYGATQLHVRRVQQAHAGIGDGCALLIDNITRHVARRSFSARKRISGTRWEGEKRQKQDNTARE
jgi:hypothetical protein